MADTKRATDWVASILSDGGRPADYRESIAERCGVTVAQVDAVIAQACTPTAAVLHSEDVAQRRLQAEATYYRTAARRASDHEEE